MPFIIPTTVHEKNKNLIYFDIHQDDGKWAGNLNLVFEKNGDEIYLDYIEVFPEFRNKGIGTDIITKLIDFAKRFGSKRIYLLVDFDNEKAQQLYTNLDFVMTGNITPSFCYEMELLL